MQQELNFKLCECRANDVDIPIALTLTATPTSRAPSSNQCGNTENKGEEMGKMDRRLDGDKSGDWDHWRRGDDNRVC